MAWLAIGGVVCLGFVLLLVSAVVLLLVYSSYCDKAAQQRIRETGKPVLAVLVMANSQFLQEKRIASAPALTIFSHEPPSTSLAATMREVATELFSLYTAEPAAIAGLAPYQQKVAELIKNDGFKESRRNRVPPEMTSGRVIYMADIWVERDRLPDHVAFSRVLACMVTGADEGEIMVLPQEEEPAQRIYAAAGAG